MPVSGWTGKLQGIGNGGFAGSISFGGLADSVRHGYAAASTDTGHTGTDASWALGHPEKIVDYGHRAIHETAVKAKAIIAAYYGSAPKRSYFSSCSNGGRQGLMEAQRYPEDYDGIIAGAPANYWTHLLATFASDILATASGSAGYIPSSKLPAIQAAALRACDANDAVSDGVIENPAQCRLDSSALECQAAESDGCLTAPQVQSLKKIYDGLRDQSGKQIFPGFSPGGEAEAGGWGPWITGPGPEKSAIFFFATNFFRNMVFNDPAWDYRTFSLDRDLKAATKLAGVLNATDPDLRRFQARGGKLILYHGWSDAAIPAQNAIDYYQSVVKKIGRKKNSSFVRLYMVPGMQHCGGGSGPNSFGQGGVPRGDASRDVAAALERWVEQGVAPEEIIATKFKSGTNPASGIVRTRPLCPYPMVARYKGTGSTDDAANFECAAPAKAR